MCVGVCGCVGVGVTQCGLNEKKKKDKITIIIIITE